MAKPLEQVATSKADANDNGRYTNTLSDFLRRYQRPEGEPRRDILEGRYQINLAEPLPEFDTKTARAYAATDMADSTRRFFALVCSHGTLQRYHVIQPLKNAPHVNLLPLMAAGVVALSQPQEERFVIIYERPLGKKLSQLLVESPGVVTDHFITRNIITPLASAIDHLSKMGIPHGSINPANIYFHETAVLGDCVSMPCGDNQPFYYEPVERMQALPAAKGEGISTQDYYALAVLTLQLLHGPGHFADFNPTALIGAILREGAYAVLTRNKENPEVFYDFLRGTLYQTPKDCWDYTQIKLWIEGKRFNMLVPPGPIPASRPFEFQDMEAGNRRELAHLLYTRFDLIAPILETGQLTQWVLTGLRNKELSDLISQAGKSALEAQGKKEVAYNEHIMRLLVLLDPEGPVRLGKLSFHIDGMETLCASLFMAKADTELQLLSRFIEFNAQNFVLEQRRKNPAYQVPSATNTTITKLDKLRVSIRNTSLGFGPERILYDLNPDMACQSRLFDGLNISNLPALLVKLDQLAPRLSNEQDPIDRHIAAFLASKLNIQYDIRLPELSGLPSLASNKAVIALHMLSLAQAKTGMIQLPGLTHWLGLRILPLLESIRSRVLRDHMKIMLISRAQSGSLTALAELIISGEYASADHQGFSDAWTAFQANAVQINSYRKGENIEKTSQGLGLFLSKSFAYVAFFITLFIIIMDR